ncbi:flagellar basal body P-ring protein FlgI [Buchnera aphidicola]|uniref:flagellar basal body P-ring protein FlgI n=1 Tax=Buchnera aphidicola TaxID=9 RepID=UPI0034641E8B
MLKVIILLPLLFVIFFNSYSYADKIRDLASIQGIRENPLIGYGLIVGLDGTGDQTIQSPYTTQSLNNMLTQLGVNLSSNNNMNFKNVASVIVTAKLPPFSHLGEQIDVTVSSIGNSKSLRGGTLLMTPLRGADNQIYAIAQGNILVAERNNIDKKASFLHSNEVNAGKINNGATIEREVNNNFGKNKTINLQLNKENFSTAQRISDMINMKYQDMAKPINSKTVQLSMLEHDTSYVNTIANIENIDVPMPLQEAKVVVNARTGSVVMNQEVQLGSCAISHGQLSLLINQESLQSSLSEIRMNIQQKKKLYKQINQTALVKLNSLNNANLNNIIQALNILGARPEELMSILQSMKSAGCLHAKLEIM